MDLGGLVLGLLFGALITSTNFCTMGAVSDAVIMGDFRRLRAWVLAAATAIIGVQSLQALGLVPLERSIYLAPQLNWVGHVLGGLLFGIGMVFAGGCVSRNLARCGSGDLRALVTLGVLGLTAGSFSLGPAAPVRQAIADTMHISLSTPTQGLGDVVAAALASDPATTRITMAALVSAALASWCFAGRGLRSSPHLMVTGLGIGILVVLGWLWTSVSLDAFRLHQGRLESLTFVRPMALTLATLQLPAASLHSAFALSLPLGTVLGAFAVSSATGRFRLQTFSGVGDSLRSLAGAVLMGIGGVMALGCTIGQGVTGVSTLALGSLITFVCFVAGGGIGVVLLEFWHASED